MPQLIWFVFHVLVCKFVFYVMDTIKCLIFYTSVCCHSTFCYIYPLTTKCFLLRDIKMTLLFYSKNHNSCSHVANSISWSSRFAVPQSRYNDVELVELSLVHYCYLHCVKMLLFVPSAVLWSLWSFLSVIKILYFSWNVDGKESKSNSTISPI